MEQWIFGRGSGAFVCPSDSEPGVWLSRGERFFAARKRTLAASLDATHHCSPQIDRSIWQRIDRVSLSSQSPDTGILATAGKGDRVGGQQSFEHCASRRTGSATL